MTSGTTSPSGELKLRVQRFWDRQPCGAKLAQAPEGTAEFYAQVEQRRYELEPFIPTYADFGGARGRRVLEIGAGLGTDLLQFARAEAHVTGVDLSPRSVELVRRRLALEGLTADLSVADAEQLPFEDATFDRVYSWGVLHHTPNTFRAAAEATRVLTPGGELCVMLYARRSWVALGLWARYALARGRPRVTIAAVLSDHMESEGTKGYSRDELEGMFSSLDELRIEQVATPYDRRVAGPVAGLTGRWLGWFSVIRGRKPHANP